MHVPDGFIDAPVSVATGAVAAVAVAVSLRGARNELADTAGAGGSGGGERTAPLAGLVAAFIFAVQMLNFPVAAGTSGHLLGGALAAILVGPCTGVLCVSVVLLMQGVLFADGGLTALGVNITDMAVVTTVVAYGIFRALLKLAPRRRRTVTVASFVAALVSVPAAAVAFTALYALGGTTDVPIGKVFTAMVGVHVLIGIGEAAITALTVGAVMAVRPDLVHGARDVAARALEIRPSPLTTPAPAGAVAARSAEAEAVPAAAGGTDAAPADAAPADAPAVGRPVVGEAGARAEATAEPAASAHVAGSDGAARSDGAAAGAKGASAAESAAGARVAAPVAEKGTSAAGGRAAEPVATGAGAAATPSGLADRAPAAAEAAPAVGGAGERAHAAGDGRAAERVAAAQAATGPAAAGPAAGDPAAAGGPGGAVPVAPRRSARRVWLAGLAATLLCAGVVSFYASASPDGLEKVAHDKGIDKKTEDHAAKDSPLADYGVKDVSDARLSGGLAGVIGVGATLTVGSGVFVLVRRRKTAAAEDRSESRV